jgi:hypothetical protein
MRTSRRSRLMQATFALAGLSASLNPLTAGAVTVVHTGTLFAISDTAPDGATRPFRSYTAFVPPAFDTTLGVLESVQITVRGARDHDVTFSATGPEGALRLLESRHQLGLVLGNDAGDRFEPARLDFSVTASCTVVFPGVCRGANEVQAAWAISPAGFAGSEMLALFSGGQAVRVDVGMSLASIRGPGAPGDYSGSASVVHGGMNWRLEYQYAPVPEPATAAMLLLGLAAMTVRAARQHQTRAQPRRWAATPAARLSS